MLVDNCTVCTESGQYSSLLFTSRKSDLCSKKLQYDIHQQHYIYIIYVYKYVIRIHLLLDGSMACFKVYTM
jgi:hypothetical protein